MNILVITQIYPQPDDVGDDRPTNTVQYFAREWMEMGHHVTVIHCPSKFPIFFYWMPQKLKEQISNHRGTQPFPAASRMPLCRSEFGIRIYRFPMMKIYPGKSFSRSSLRRQVRTIQSVINDDGFMPDIVVGHFANPSLEIVADIAEYYRIPSSMVFHHDCTPANIHKYRIKELIPKIGAVGARSIGEARRIQKELSLEMLPFVCYSGVPNDLVKKSDGICLKQDYCHGISHIYVGSMLKRKHVDTLIKAFGAKYKGRNARLDIIGGGQEEGNLRRLVDALGLEEQIKFFGTMPRAEAIRKMRDAQVFTMVSHGEAFGMVYIEAMLQGCLVVASKGEGFDGIIQDGVNGFLCRAGDVDSLIGVYEKIDSMTAAERNAIGQKAIETAAAFSERAVAEKYLNNVMRRNGLRG